MSILARAQRLARRALGVRPAASSPPPARDACEAMRGTVGPLGLEDHRPHEPGPLGQGYRSADQRRAGLRRQLAPRQAEYEISSNPVMEGMVNTFKTDVVGPQGPSYRVQSRNPSTTPRGKRSGDDWARHAGANRQLSLVEILNSWVGSLWKAGEFGTQMITDPDAPGPIKMRLLPVHMHRLLTPPEMLGDPAVALGVRRDANRNPVCYYVTEPYTFGPFEVYTGEFKTVRYEDFIHGYRFDEEDQVRGVPGWPLVWTPWARSATGTRPCSTLRR